MSWSSGRIQNWLLALRLIIETYYITNVWLFSNRESANFVSVCGCFGQLMVWRLDVYVCVDVLVCFGFSLSRGFRVSRFWCFDLSAYHHLGCRCLLIDAFNLSMLWLLTLRFVKVSANCHWKQTSKMTSCGLKLTLSLKTLSRDQWSNYDY